MMKKEMETVHLFKNAALKAKELNLQIGTSEALMLITDGERKYTCSSVDELLAFIAGYEMAGGGD